MRRSLIVIAILLALSAGVYRLYQDPRVRELFRPISSGRTRPSPRVGPANRVSKVSPMAPRKAAPAGSHTGPQESESDRAPSGDAGDSEAFQNQVPNDQVTRVLLRILAAMKLSDGIGLTVSDRRIVVAGVVESQEKRRRILEVIDKGREARMVDAAQLLVQGENR